MSFAVSALSKRRHKAVSALVALSLLTTTLTSELAFAKTPKPTQAQIDAAKAVEAAKAAAASAAWS